MLRDESYDGCLSEVEDSSISDRTEGDEFEISGSVVKAKLNKTLSLLPLFQRLALVDIGDAKKRDDDRGSPPFFGVESGVISIRYGDGARGWREAKPGSPFADADIQIFGATIHVKISDKYLSCMGKITENQAVLCFEALISHLVKTRVDWEPFMNITLDEFIEAGVNFWESSGEAASELQGLFLSHVHDVNVKDLDTWIGRLTSIHSSLNTPIYSNEDGNEISYGDPEICNGIYNYSIADIPGYGDLFKGLLMIKLRKVESHFSEDLGYAKSKFFNWTSPKKMFLNIDIDEEYTLVKAKKSRKHTFTIDRFGIVKQTSPTFHCEAKTIMNRVMTQLLDFLSKNESYFKKIDTYK
jgi:hypothetical protein